MKYEHSDSGSPVNSRGKWKDIVTDICHNKTLELQRLKKFEISWRKKEQ